MPRPRTNDPLYVSDNPVTVQDAERKAELIAEFKNKLSYIRSSYKLAMRWFGGGNAFNESINQLVEAVNGRTPGELSGKRLSPFMEMAVSHHARRFAAMHTGKEEAEVTGEDVRRASHEVAKTLKPIAHRPQAIFLKHYVEGLMAVIQQYSGRPVLTGRYRNSVYDPHFKSGVSQIVPLIMQDIDPSLSTGQLVSLVERIRRENAGKHMRFYDSFPFYGASLDSDGELHLVSGYQIKKFIPNIPTYFH